MTARVHTLAVRTSELAEAQKRTEEELRKLARGLRETRQMAGGLSHFALPVLTDSELQEVLKEILPR